MKRRLNDKTKKILFSVAGILGIAIIILGGIAGLNYKERQDRVNRANTAMDNFLSYFYTVSEDGKTGIITGGHFWTRAEMFEIVVDAYEQTGDEKYRDLMWQMYQGFIEEHGEDWNYNTYNDDLMWMTIGCARAYQLTGETEYKETAVKHFNMVYDRAWSDELGGGLFWRTDNQCKNSCINCPAVIAASLLYQITEEQGYLDKALQIYQWQIDTLYQENGAVYDNINLQGEYNTWCSTYNQGTFIGASHLLYKITGEQAYLDRAIKAADYTMNEMYAQGVISNEDEGSDLPGFKGILMRWLGKLVEEEGLNQYRDWMLLNAESAWNNQNEKGMMSTLWGEKTEDKFYMPWGCSAGVALLFAVIDI